jgi:hypothetical protein
MQTMQPKLFRTFASLALLFPLLFAARGDSTIITNPAPAAGDGFGYCVAATGEGQVLVGAPYRDYLGTNDVGAAYLFDTNGLLQQSFGNPTHSAGGNFGWAVAGAGDNQVLIGAPEESPGGAAYLFASNGTLLCIFTNPTATLNAAFGIAVAAVGTDRVLIGAPDENTGAVSSGAAYLFGTNGSLIGTFSNPTPEIGDIFGHSVAAVGTDQVLIGAWQDNTGATQAGAAYLFNTNGALITTFTNPAPEDFENFGYSVAAVGSDRVLIGAPYDRVEHWPTGMAYLFSTNGVLLTTFSKPNQARFSTFGWSVAAAGSGRVLIGAAHENFQQGGAYLFTTNGSLLMTFTNEPPLTPSYFGFSVALLGNDYALVGAITAPAGAPQAGAAYLFNLNQAATGSPQLSISLDPQLFNVTVSWPLTGGDWQLEHTNALPSPATAIWPPVFPPYLTNGGTISVTLTNAPSQNEFFRLRKL